MEFKNYDGMFVTNHDNKRYLTGFKGSTSEVVMTAEKTILITDGRYQTQVKNEVYKNVEVVIAGTPTSYFDTLLNVINDLGIKKLGIEANHLSVSRYTELAESLPAVELVQTKNLVEELRICKNADEIAKTKKAVEITDQTFKYLCQTIKPGMTEMDIKLMADNKQIELGAEKPSFDMIVASGENSAKPHAVPSSRVIEDGDIVTLDFGCFYDGYCSDMTRTIFVGTPKSEKLIEIHNLVKKAMETQIKAVAPGVRAVDIDTIAREMFAEHGYDQYFIHGTGHGTGLEIHEGPTVSKNSQDVLRPGMIITIEPGIYIEGIGGVRIENDIVVTETGYEQLNKSNPDFDALIQEQNGKVL